RLSRDRSSDVCSSDLLSIGVMIVPSDPTEAELMRQEPLLYTGSNERIGGVRLELVGPPEPPRVGEVFTIDVVLDNRVHSMLDGEIGRASGMVAEEYSW